MCRQILIARLIGCVCVISGCGYHSINRPPINTCSEPNRLSIDHQMNQFGAQASVHSLVDRYFNANGDEISKTEFRVQILPVRQVLMSFSQSGQLASKIFEVTSILDVVEDKGVIWSVRHTGFSSPILNRSDPMWSSAAEDSGLRQALEKSIAGLRARYEAKCRRKFTRKEEQ